MRQITFDYSTNGTTFQTVTYTLSVLTARCYLMPYSESETNDAATMGSNSTKCQKYSSRLNVDIIIAPNDLDPTRSTTADAAWVYVQKWACAPLRRIYNASSSSMPNIDGWSQFDSSGNTNYVNLRSDPSYEFEDLDDKASGGKKIRRARLELETRNAVSI